MIDDGFHKLFLTTPSVHLSTHVNAFFLSLSYSVVGPRLFVKNGGGTQPIITNDIVKREDHR